MKYVEEQVYRKFVRILSAAAYVSPQGRPQAIMDLRNKQLPELREKQFVLSSTSKTASTFGYQPVTLGQMFETCIDKYVRFVRPTMKQRANDYLFIDMKGQKLNIGQKLTTDFRSTMNLQ